MTQNTDPSYPGGYPQGSYPPPPGAPGQPQPYASYGYQYPGAPGYYGAPPMAPTNNGLAIASLICSIVGLIILPLIASVLAIIFGAVALRQIRDSGGRMQGRGLAIAGIVIGAIGAIFGACIVIAVIVTLANPNAIPPSTN